MAPPERSDEPVGDGVDALTEARLEGSRMRPNAARLASWVEWLLHPEEHEHDRTVIYPDGTRREEPGPVTTANKTPGHFDPVELEFESVLAQYPLVGQYLDGMAAFSTQKVERTNSLLAIGAAAIKNVWWAGDTQMSRLLSELPDEDDWGGPAATARVPVMRRLALVGCVALFWLAGCTGDEPVDRVTDRPVVDLPADRDENTVVTALRRADLCSVLGTAAGPGERVVASSPARCALGEPSPEVVLRVGTLDSQERLVLAATGFSGAKAYVDQRRTDRCAIHFPVSFRLAVTLETTGNSCARAEELADGVAAGLTGSTGAAPVWEACALLRTVPGTEPGPVEDLDSCVDTSSSATLELVYPQDFPPPLARRETIGGAEVWATVDTDPDHPSCALEWAPAAERLVVRLRATTCEAVEPMVAPIHAEARTPPPETTATGRLLYGPDEPDRRFAGACGFADLRGARPQACSPFTNAPAEAVENPLDTGDEPGAACALALAAVTEHFGDLRAVVVDEHGTFACYFVAPERLVQVEFSVSPRTTFDQRPGARTVEIEGHTGNVFTERPPRPGYRYVIAASPDSGVLRLRVTAGPVAGAELGDGGAKAERVLADVLRQHFGGRR
ncbi:hypothetical protein BLA60_40265 [Actinophytocola xinjiangensis]|uniref:Uncharacterized protein n=1 Tax=Actinophytocola xinjiangensis TaxID=485602 RepID=A0A7Z0WDZ8_9PSEU|nr:hypothetical protein [Actinophytocola xinjiangensis]OLF04528.1 hypothetical protein BLA60_40265 [Actinophytocola xinjiangensis]